MSLKNSKKKQSGTSSASVHETDNGSAGKNKTMVCMSYVHITVHYQFKFTSRHKK